MSYTYEIKDAIRDFRGDAILVVEIRITISNDKFEIRSMPMELLVTDGSHEALSFVCYTSGNQKELMAYFTVDAFDNFTSNSTIKLGYGDEYKEIIMNVDVHDVESLPAIVAAIPHQIADNDWLTSLS